MNVVFLFRIFDFSKNNCVKNNFGSYVNLPTTPKNFNKNTHKTKQVLMKNRFHDEKHMNIANVVKR